MSGRKKQQVFIYDIFGKYIDKFPSEADFKRAYYPDDIGKRPLFNWKELDTEYHINLSAEIIAYRSRMNREKTKLIVAIHNSEYCKSTDHDERPVQVFNLKNELIAEFASQRLLGKFMPDKISAVSRILNSKVGSYKISNPPGGLFFKYKEKEFCNVMSFEIKSK